MRPLSLLGVLELDEGNLFCLLCPYACILAIIVSPGARMVINYNYCVWTDKKQIWLSGWSLLCDFDSHAVPHAVLLHTSSS